MISLKEFHPTWINGHSCGTRQGEPHGIKYMSLCFLLAAHVFAEARLKELRGEAFGASKALAPPPTPPNGRKKCKQSCGRESNKSDEIPFWGRCTAHFGRDFSGDWDVHWGITGVLTHGHVFSLVTGQIVGPGLRVAHT